MNITCMNKIASQVFGLLDKLTPVWWLGLRLWIGWVFFASGLTKINDMESTFILFEYEYAVPLIPVAFAAYSATFFELVMPVLLALGVAVRFAAAPLLVMTAVIQFTYLDHVQHYYWAIILIGLILHGGGKLSLDNLIKKKYSAPDA